MTAVLKVNDSGTWRTVVEPYVNVDGTWKTVHNISIKHGGTWRLAHKTAFGRYSLITDESLLNMTNESAGGSVSGSYTVATGVRYLKVSITGGGGQGGGSVQANGTLTGGKHWRCPIGSTNGTEEAYGGQGGHAGHLNITFEVIPGETYTWSGGVGGYQGGGNSGPLTLPATGTISPVSTTKSGGTGQSGSALSFTGSSGTLSAGGGLGGSPGVVTVNANCTNALLGHGYNVTATSPSQTAQDANSISATNLIATTTNGVASSGGGAGSGNVGVSPAAGYSGSNGTVSIWQYG
tara:strand:+ start:4965 stop:5843 length:879 start_codon:yes stop_codon:yes gene_type:complete